MQSVKWAVCRRAWVSQQLMNVCKSAPLEASDTWFMTGGGVVFQDSDSESLVGSHQRRDQMVPYLDEGDAVGWHGDVVAELVEEVRRNPQGGAAKPELIRPERRRHYLLLTWTFKLKVPSLSYPVQLFLILTRHSSKCQGVFPATNWPMKFRSTTDYLGAALILLFINWFIWSLFLQLMNQLFLFLHLTAGAEAE